MSPCVTEPVTPYGTVALLISAVFSVTPYGTVAGERQCRHVSLLSKRLPGEGRRGGGEEFTLPLKPSPYLATARHLRSAALPLRRLDRDNPPSNRRTPSVANRDFALSAASHAASAKIGDLARALRKNGYKRLTSRRADGSISYRWIKRTAEAAA